MTEKNGPDIAIFINGRIVTSANFASRCSLNMTSLVLQVSESTVQIIHKLQVPKTKGVMCNGTIQEWSY